MNLSVRRVFTAAFIMVAVISGLVWMSVRDKGGAHHGTHVEGQSGLLEPARATEPTSAHEPNISAGIQADNGDSQANVGNGRSNISEQFYSATNYFDLASQLYPSAETGNPQAQYFLYRVLIDCEDWVRTRAESTAGRTLVEKLTPSSVGDAFRDFRIEHYYRCVQFLHVGPDTFRSAEYWLNQAVANGYSGAISRFALNMLFFAEDQGDAESAKELLRKSLNQPSPEAIWDLATVYNSDVLLESRDERLAAATRLLSCKSGLNCSTTANNAIQIECVSGQWSCTSDNFIDSLQQHFGSEFGVIEKLASEVNFRIQNENWAELGLL